MKFFRLVRLTGSFPHLVYVLSFDRARVEHAIGEDGLPGSEYLEKIVQLFFDVPPPHPEQLRRLLIAALEERTGSKLSRTRLDERRWPRILLDVIMPQIRNMRDVYRVVHGIDSRLDLLIDQIDLVDILALETTRVQHPAIYQSIVANVDLLTKPPVTTFGTGNDSQFQGIQQYLESQSKSRPLLTSIVDTLFPAGEAKRKSQFLGGGFEEEWLEERRVASYEILKLYRSCSPSDALTLHWLAESALDRMTDADSLRSFFLNNDPSKWEDLVSAIERHKANFTIEMILPTTVVLLSLKQEFPERRRPMFDFGLSIKLGRVILRLLEQLDNEAEVENLVQSALDMIPSLDGKLSLVRVVGHEEHAGSQLVSAQAANQMELKLRDEIRNADPNLLAQESSAFGLMLWAKRNCPETESSVVVPHHSELVSRLVVGSFDNVKSSPLDGSGYIEYQPYLDWNSLIELFDGEDRLIEMIDRFSDALRANAPEIFELSERYRSGWRPDYVDRFGR